MFVKQRLTESKEEESQSWIEIYDFDVNGQELTDNIKAAVKEREEIWGEVAYMADLVMQEDKIEAEIHQKSKQCQEIREVIKDMLETYEKQRKPAEEQYSRLVSECNEVEKEVMKAEEEEMKKEIHSIRLQCQDLAEEIVSKQKQIETLNEMTEEKELLLQLEEELKEMTHEILEEKTQIDSLIKHHKKEHSKEVKDFDRMFGREEDILEKEMLELQADIEYLNQEMMREDSESDSLFVTNSHHQRQEVGLQEKTVDHQAALVSPSHKVVVTRKRLPTNISLEMAADQDFDGFDINYSSY